MLKKDKIIVESTLLLLKKKKWKDLRLSEIKKKSKVINFDELIESKNIIIKKINKYFDYKLSLKVNSESDSGLISVSVNQLETNSFKIMRNSRGWNWTPPQQVKLNSGINTVKLQIEQGGFNIESLKISK